MLVASIVLFLLVLGVSRLADFGIVDGDPFGAANVERNRADVELVTEGGLALRYGPTRYPYVWIVGVDAKGVAHPMVAGRHTRPNGETLALEPLGGRFTLLCLFSAVPRTLVQIQEALDRDVRLPGLRYAWVVGGDASASALP
jgi:hypothetical protein